MEGKDDFRLLPAFKAGNQHADLDGERAEVARLSSTLDDARRRLSDARTLVERRSIAASEVRSLKHEDRTASLTRGDMEYFLVADGHGGASVAEWVSKHLLEQLASAQEELRTMREVRPALLCLGGMPRRYA